MIVRFCLDCKYHRVKEDGEERKSHCGRENMWSQFTKCIATKALQSFLEKEERPKSKSTFSALNHFYPLE